MRALSAAAAPLALLVAAPLLLPAPAEACGGFFCSTGPVDQKRESILFEVNEDGSTSAIVEVVYNGDPGDFSWVIPVPEVPELDVVPSMVLDILDVYARPRIIPPPLSYDNCDDWDEVAQASGYGCTDSSPMALERSAGEGEGEGEPVVRVTELERVGPYDDIVVVESQDPDEMINWLNTNGYIITPPMEPLVAEYVAEGQKFLALKLAPDAGVQDISPIKFTCPGENPTVPLRLTAVAAEPDMRIYVHIAGMQRYRPMNYREVTIDESRVRTDLWGWRNNYDGVVSWQVDQEGGQAFVTERAHGARDLREQLANVNPSNDDEEAAQQYLVELLGRRPYLSRFYTRMSASDMIDDPSFAVAAGDDVDGVIDLSNRPVRDACDPDIVSEPTCGFSYCGAGSRCGVTEGGEEGCVCDEGLVARQVLEPTQRFAVPTVTCQDPGEDLLGTDSIGDPCDGFGCDNGSCVAVNGFPTCQCDAGFVAVVDMDRPAGVLCVTPAETFEQSALFPTVDSGELGTGENGISGIISPDVGCTSMVAQARAPAFAEVAALMGLLWLVRRRRRRH
jgi:hypothetical protein